MCCLQSMIKPLMRDVKLVAKTHSDFNSSLDSQCRNGVKTFSLCCVMNMRWKDLIR